MKKTIVLLALIVLCRAAHAEDALPDRPHWSLEVKGGSFTPSLADWSFYYGKKDMTEFAASLAYKLLPQLDFGAGAGWIEGKGRAYQTFHQTLTGDVNYDLYPVEVFVVVRGAVTEDQWVIPYIGGGWTRMYYRQQAPGQETVHGSADGYHVRGGLQFSLDILDQSASRSMYRDYGVYNTYFFIETEYTHAVVPSVSTDLGGKAWLAGLLFEF